MSKKSLDGQHTPVWPHIQQTYSERVLAYLDVDGTVYSEPLAGLVPEKPETWQALSDLLYSWDSLIWCYDLVSALIDSMPCILAEDYATREQRAERGKQWCELFLGDDDNVVMVTVHRLVGRRWRMRHFANAAAWGQGVPSHPREIPSWLGHLRWLFDTLGAGIHPTPGSTGVHTMQHGWREHEDWRPHHRPPLHAVKALHAHGIGGRIEVYQQRRTFDVAFELDMHNAYCAFAGQVPDGVPSYIPERPYDGRKSLAWRLLWPPHAPELDNVTWFAHCAVAIREDLPPGDILPFAVRSPTPNDPHRLLWPTAKGMYECWLWREEAEALHARMLAGDPVELCEIDEAFIWHKWTDHLAPWASRMDSIRESAPSKPHERLVKACMVAGIGRLAMPYERRSLVHDDDWLAGDVDWTPPWAPENCWNVRTRFEDSGLPAAWPVYIWMRTNLAIYEAARAEHAVGNQLIAMHVDALIVTRRPQAGRARFKLPAAMGEFRVSVHTPFRATAPGVLLSPQKFRAAGIPKKRQALLRMGEHEKPLENYEGHERTRREFRAHSRMVHTAQLERFERRLGYG